MSKMKEPDNLVGGWYKTVDQDEIQRKNKLAMSDERSRDSAEALSKENFSKELIEKFAKRLKQNQGLSYSHRDFCGHGIEYSQGRYELVEIHDGDFNAKNVILSWKTEEEFIVFMIGQSDYTMSCKCTSFPEIYSKETSGWGNQTISEKRISDYIIGYNPAIEDD